MAHIQTDNFIGTLEATREKTRLANHIQHAQMMLLAAGLTAFGIVAVAATMMMTLL